MSPVRGRYGCARGDGRTRTGMVPVWVHEWVEGKVSMAQNEQNWDRENADDQLNEQVTPWSQRAFADDAVEDPAGDSAGESAGESVVEESSLGFSDAPAEDIEDNPSGNLEDGIAHDYADGFDNESSILPGYTPSGRVSPSSTGSTPPNWRATSSTPARATIPPLTTLPQHSEPHS